MVRIAIVDDNESWCFVLQSALQQQGFTVDTFSDPWLFLQRADSYKLAIVDFCLPAPRYRREIDGVTLIKQIRAELAQPPLLMLISSFFPEDDPEGLQSFCEEADLVLPRPRRIAALVQPIQNLLGRSSRSYASARSSA